MSKNKKTKINAGPALDIITSNASDVVFTTAVTALSIINPIWTILFLTAKGIYGAWSDFGQERINEIVADLEKNKDKLNSKVVESDKFKSVFLSVIERHMKESSEERRHFLRNYLISTAQGHSPTFNYHTKLLNVLDQITGDELRLFMLLPNIIQDADNEHLAYATEESRKAFNPMTRELHMNTLQIKMRLKNWKIKTKDLSTLMRFLSNYGLIVTYDVSYSGIGGGGSNELIFSGITDTGQVFYELIDEPQFNKDITTYIEYRDNPSLRVGSND